MVVARWPGTRRRPCFAAWLVLLALAGVACGDETDDGRAEQSSPTSEVPVPTITVSTGELVRGSLVTLEIDHLVATQGHGADVSVVTPEEVFVGGRDIVGYRVVGETEVSREGSALITFHLPNTLSGEDDVIPLEPGQEYVLELAARERPGITDRVPFRVMSAREGVSYSVTAWRGSQECGAPPLEIDFDGELWTPDDATVFPKDQASFDGELVIQPDGSGAFTWEEGERSSFRQAPSGYSC